MRVSDGRRRSSAIEERAADPAKHRLVVHAWWIGRSTLSMAELRRLPSLTGILVLECGGNRAVSGDP